MNPRPGGEADKIGNRYELAWVVRHLLFVLTGDAKSITVEDVGDLAQGSEFTLRRESVLEVHQVKRQNNTKKYWTVRALASLGIWENARLHVEAGRPFHFVSTISTGVINTLCDRARRSASAEVFVAEWLSNKEENNTFTELTAPDIFGSAEKAWSVLAGMTATFHDESELTNGNAALAGVLFGGVSGSLAAAGLGQLVLDNLGRELTLDVVSHLLPDYGLDRVTAAQIAERRSAVERITANWSASVDRLVLQPAIVRPEAAALAALLTEPDCRVLFVVGGAGGGKSVVLRDFVAVARAKGNAVLAFRLDRLPQFWSTDALGEALNLTTSPVSALNTAMQDGERQGILVIDQLDAVSVLSGRTPENFEAVANLILEATAYPRMRVVLACRKFDLENDDQIRSLAAQPLTKRLAVELLTDAQINDSVTAMGLDGTKLTSQQRAILRTPLHLVLLQSIADEPNALDFQTSTHLFDAFCYRKEIAVDQRRRGVQFSRILAVLAESMSDQQQLSTPRSVLDADGLTRDSDVLVSEHVLARDGSLLAFFHESFFDYVFSRNWIHRQETLTDFLGRGEQELFRRAQVRQILTHLRDTNPRRFVEELAGTLQSGDVRFHIKTAALSIAGALVDPSGPEAALLLRLATDDPLLSPRIWNLLRSPAWFARLDADGEIEAWLKGDTEAKERALTLMTGAGEGAGDRLAELLTMMRDDPNYASRARWIIRFSEVHVSRALFDVLLEAVRAGFYNDGPEELWLSAIRLNEVHPEWGTELLHAFLVDAPGALALDEQGRVMRLRSGDYQAMEMMQKSASADPRSFTDSFLPYVLQVLAATEYGTPPDEQTRSKIYSHHFSFRYRVRETPGSLEDVLFDSLVGALPELASSDPEGMRPTLEILADDSHDAAQVLLYSALIGNPEAFAEWAASLLLGGGSRLLCGYTDNSVWIARELLQAIIPYLSDDVFTQLEEAVRDVHFPWEQGHAGWYAFNLLSGLDESRLSEAGRRRLGEYRRRFNQEQPEEPQGIRMGTFSSPIRGASVERMSDDDWLRAMAKYSTDREDWRDFSGGVNEFASTVREQTKASPLRFARLALRLTHEHHPSYGDAVLMGLGDAETMDDPTPVFDAVRHIASLGHDENDRWIGSALRPYLKDVPLDLVELIRHRAMEHPDPSDDGIRVWTADRESGKRLGHVYESGINTARGSLVEGLANLLITDDAAGTRTTLVAPVLDELAVDPSVPVRACVAHLISASLRHARPAALAAFSRLIDADDALLATRPVTDLLMFVGNGDSSLVRPIVERMLISGDDSVREVGGQFACLGALEWDQSDLLRSVVDGDDSLARRGAAMVAAVRLRHTSDAEGAAAALDAFLDDSDPNVRENAARVVVELREGPLRPFVMVLRRVIESASFREALPQLLFALEQAPDRVDDLVLLCASRFVEVHGEEAGDFRTSAAADSRHVAQLIVRGLAQAPDAAARKGLLDVLDRLLEIGAWGIDDVLGESERP